MTYARQISLPFPSEPRYAPEDFCEGAANEVVLAWLSNPAAWPFGRLAVSGEAGAGKTHLLHVFAARHRAALIPVASIRTPPAPVQAAALAIDDADTAPDEAALLHLLNFAAERRQPVLLTARTPPARWTCRLPDLMSRLRATQTVALLPPDDALLRAVLLRLLADHQLRVAPPVAEFLLTHLPRTGAALREAVARLDRLSLAGKCAVTRGLAQVVVHDMSDADADHGEQENGPEGDPPGLF